MNKDLNMNIADLIFILIISLTGCVSLDSVDKKGILSKAVVKLNPPMVIQQMEWFGSLMLWVV